MMRFLFLCILIAAIGICPHLGSELSFKLATIERNGEVDSCPSTVEQNSLESDLLSQIRNNASSILAGFMRVPQCGNGPWYRVAYFNVSDSTQECPSNWNQLQIDTLIRACGRSTSTGVRCLGEYFPTRGLQYGKVCGRVIGYQEGSADTFVRFGQNQQPTIDEPYVDGVSVTYGMPRTHIWTFAAGASEGTIANHTTNCPCANEWAAANSVPAPSFVGDNYFCESGNPGVGLGSGGIIFEDDPLWDGEQCEGECCSNGSSPPWFSVILPNPTSDDIEVRICGDEDTSNEDTPVQLLEIFVQ